MSFNLEQVRRIYSDPIIGKISSFSKRIAKIESDSISEFETDDLTGFGDSDHTKVIYTDYWNFARQYRKYFDYVKLDGTDDFIDLGAKTGLWSRSLDRFTVALRVRPSVLSSSYRTFFGCADDPSENDEISFYFTNDTSDGLYHIGADVTNDAYGHTAEVKSTVPCDIIGNEYHALLSYDRFQSQDNRLKLYVNGVLQSYVDDNDDTLGNPVINIDSGTKALIGKYISTDTNEYGGNVRDFKWFNTSVTAAEAMYIYTGDVRAPIANYWLPMNDYTGSGNPVDRVSGTFTGSLQNGALFVDRSAPLVCFEPDFNKLRLDLRFDHFGRILEDRSGFGNNMTVEGEPCPTTGSDVRYRGGFKRNTGWKFSKADRVTLIGSNDGAFQMIGPQSWIFRLNFASLEDTDPITGFSRSSTLVEKYDDSNNQYFIRVDDAGDVKAGFKDGGVSVVQRTSSNPIKAGQDHEIVVTYNDSGDVVTFYVDGRVQPSTSSSESYDSTTDTPLRLLSENRAAGFEPEQGMCDLNYIDLIRYYDDMVLTAQQVKNHYKNKFTISDIEEGEVGITDASCTEGILIVAGSYTLTSFTTDSFTAS